MPPVPTVVHRAFRLSGLTRLIGHSEWRRRRLMILCYHGVASADEHLWDPQLYVSRETFARRLTMLDRHGCAVLPLAEAIQRVYDGTLPPRAVALTFDDGYVDFMRHAWPLLRQHGFPATVYLATMRCEHNLPVVPILLSYLLWNRRDRVLTAPELPGLGGDTYGLKTAAERSRVVGKITACFSVEMTSEARDDVARALAARLDLDYNRIARDRLLAILAPDEVSQLAAEGVDFQLHTHSHRTPEDAALFREDVRVNRSKLERMTGVRPTHLCYPSGIYRKSYLPLLQAEGVVSATTTYPDIVDSSANPLLLPRFVDANGVSDVKFEAWLLGAAPWIKGVASSVSTHRIPGGSAGHAEAR